MIDQMWSELNDETRLEYEDLSTRDEIRFRTAYKAEKKANGGIPLLTAEEVKIKIQEIKDDFHQ